MKHGIAVQWIQALRSGDYAQGMGALRVQEEGGRTSYCCLGVLGYCVLKMDAPATMGSLTRDMQEASGMRSELGELRAYDGVAREPIEINTPCGDYDAPATFDSLADANDAGASFAEIADWIAAHWESL